MINTRQREGSYVSHVGIPNRENEVLVEQYKHRTIVPPIKLACK